MKKQILAVALVLSIIVSGSSVLANNYKEVISEDLKGEYILDLSDVETYEKDATTMVPLREVAEGILGLEVKWIGETRSVEIGNGPQWTSITIGENSYFFARIAPFQLSQAPELTNNLTYVPVEFFTEVLKYEIGLKDKEVEEAVLYGFIKEIKDEDETIRILVAGDEKNTGIDEVMLSIVDETILIDKAGNDFELENLKVGMKITTILPEILTLSLPAQGTAVKIIVENTDVIIEELIHESNEEIKYPTIKGLEDRLDEKINAKIEEFIKEIKDNELYEELELSYELKLLTDKKMSLLFRGTFNFYEEERQLVNSLNFNLENGDVIEFQNYFKANEDSQKELLEILENAAKDQLDMEFEAEGKQIYFRGSNVVVFYYPLDDSVTSPVELYLQLEDIENIINI